MIRFVDELPEGPNMYGINTVRQGLEIPYVDFLSWAADDNHYLCDSANDRVLKIYPEHERIVSADGFYDSEYLPWDEFTKYNKVINTATEFILVDSEGNYKEFTILTPGKPYFEGCENE